MKLIKRSPPLFTLYYKLKEYLYGHDRNTRTYWTELDCGIVPLKYRYIIIFYSNVIEFRDRNSLILLAQILKKGVYVE